MSRLGARAMRDRRAALEGKLAGLWELTPARIPVPVPRSPPRIVRFLRSQKVGEEQAKIGCELALFFMLLHVKRGSSRWYRICAEQSSVYPGGSYRSVFWWSLRFLGEPTHDCRGYLAWKIGQYDQGIIQRDGPVW